jgi:hypothetical protein
VRHAVPRGYRHGAHLRFLVFVHVHVCAPTRLPPLENRDDLPRHLLLPLLPGTFLSQDRCLDSSEDFFLLGF